MRAHEYDQSLTIFTVSFELQIILQPNIVGYFTAS